MSTFLFCTFFLTVLLTVVIEKVAARLSLIDYPVARSAHLSPKPSGGGIVIIGTFLICTNFYYFYGYILDHTFYALLGTIPIAAVGLFDDLSRASLRLRLLIQFLAVFWVIFWFEGVPSIDFSLFEITNRWVLMFLGVVSVVWLLNLYNFMDGIDAIAATEVLFVNVMSSIFAIHSGDMALALLSASLFAATAGFLVWNWPPAKLFMGDVGSSSIGFILGVLALASIHSGTLTVWTWLILLGVFVADSGVTLIVRFVNKEKWHEGHSCHAYQNVARRWESHEKVVIWILLVNLIWISPLSWISFLYPKIGFYICFFALTPLVYICIKYKAGVS